MPISLPKAEDLIKSLKLEPHIEGGFFREIHRSPESFDFGEGYNGKRNLFTHIYFMLRDCDISRFHRLKSDEFWHFYSGGRLEIHTLNENSGYKKYFLGNTASDGEKFCILLEKDTWFAASPAGGSDYSLVGCTVVPGFDFKDFELAGEKNLCEKFPAHSDIIEKFT